MAERKRYFGEQEALGRSETEGLYIDLLTHTLAVADYLAGEEPDHGTIDYIEGYDSNFLNSVYAAQDLRDTIAGKATTEPVVLSPRVKNHWTLIEATRQYYEDIHWQQMRVLLQADTSAPDQVSTAPLADDEKAALLARAQEQGLIGDTPQPLSDLEISNTASWLVVDLALKRIPFEKDKILARDKEVKALPYFKSLLGRASVLKLGCLLALAQQFSFDAQAQGQQIPKDYRPLYAFDESTLAHWQEVFGQPVQGIGSLYQTAHQLFLEALQAVGEKENPLIQHLIEINSLETLG